MKKRVLTLCLIALVPFLIFATGEPEDVAGEGGIQVSGPGELPIVEEQVTVTIMAERHAQITSMSDNYATRYMEDQTNVHIEWLDTPMAEFDEKLNLVLASGEYPDAIMDFNVAADLVVRYGSEGIFVPLNDLIQEHSPNLLEMFEQIPMLRDLITAPDGNIYGFPAVNDNFNGMFRSKMWINSSWLETLGLAMPSTTEEFYDVLRAFKDNDPNGNGIQDEIPLSAMTNYDYMRVPSFLMNAFVYWNASGPVKGLMIENGQMAFAPVTDAWREGLRYYHRLYNEELLDPAAFTQKRPELAQLGENPDDMILGAAPSNWWGKIVQSKGESGRYRFYDSVPPLTGPEGVRTAAYF
ncbi:MAG: extracellular solute-binding protein, partial [Spirochaetaceae bacterium]|nr:extracellular solute-binding protein [Spirochaetaceae bacterium]